MFIKHKSHNWKCLNQVIVIDSTCRKKVVLVEDVNITVICQCVMSTKQIFCRNTNSKNKIQRKYDVVVFPIEPNGNVTVCNPSNHPSLVFILYLPFKSAH